MILFELVLGGVAGVAHFIAGHQQSQLNRVCYFISFVYSLQRKDLTIQKEVKYRNTHLSH